MKKAPRALDEMSDAPRRRPTINDIARLAGVSKKTVSRIINRSPLVRADTREKVEALMREVGYTPDPMARGLAFRRAFLIGMVYDNPTAQYIVDMQYGALDALREALRDMTMTCEPPVNMIIGRLRDLVALLVGLTLMLSVVVGGFAVSATGTVLGWLGLGPSAAVTVLVRIAALLMALLADTLVFLVILGWLGRLTASHRALLKGALLGAVGFGVLKQIANLLLSHTLNNPIYGTFAVVVGLLVWINLSARWTMYVTAWTATAGGSPPPAPTPAPASAYT